MSISTGQPNLSRQSIIEKVSEADILGHYLNVSSIPALINSPFRQDNNPSFYLYSHDGIGVNFIDFSNGDRGGCFTLLMKLWNLSRTEVYQRIHEELLNFKKVSLTQSSRDYIKTVQIHSNVKLECKIREWADYDLEFWNSFGISLEWLKYCDVYPISHKIITKNGNRAVFRADKYAYTFVERKEGRITHKFYQPFNRNGFKWQNSHDKSVLGLWTKMPEKGKAVCICSSVKDAICLMANLKIPCICLQGEGYPISDTAMRELKRRFFDVFVCLDNDEPGLKDAESLAKKHGLINVVIPQNSGGKDISDVYKFINNKLRFINFFNRLIIDAREEYYHELPF